MAHIAQIFGREVLDSRGWPTVEVEIRCTDGSPARAIVPAGASRGRAEACELRDGDPRRYAGRGVLRAVGHVNDVLGPALVDTDPADQLAIDERLLELDGTPDKSRLGANALLGVSLAAAHAGAAVTRRPLYRHFAELLARELSSSPSGATAATSARPAPTPGPAMPLPMVNMISGGLHAGGQLDFQDFLIQPIGAPDYRTGLEWICRVYHALGQLLAARGYEGVLVGDEGGFGPRLSGHRAAAEFVVDAIHAAQLEPGKDVNLAIDVASSHFWDGQHYRLVAANRNPWTSEQLVDELERLIDDFPVVSLEDPLAEEDWAGWQRITTRLGARVQLIGDDLFATQASRVEQGMRLRAANAVLIKLNQVGTVSETLRTLLLARRAGWRTIVSARSGETEDTSIADLAVGTAADGIKIGSVARSERLAKYNRLLRIEDALLARQ